MLRKTVEYFLGLPKKQKKSILTRLFSAAASGCKWIFRNCSENFAEVILGLTAICLLACSIIFLSGFIGLVLV